MRKLASIQQVKLLKPIEGADSIEVASILGWQVVVKKEQFKLNELVVYVEIDSVLPQKEEFSFLKDRNYRIRTIRLRGQISQGICFPLSILPEDFVVEEDKDCTEVLGVTKYEVELPTYLSGIAKGKFPSFIPKTDETRVQVLQKVLDKYQGELCYITEKLDGSSVTFYTKDGEFGVCSRNLELEESQDNVFWKVAKDLRIEEKLRSLNRNIAIQGELIGNKIQGNKLGIKGCTVKFFNAFNIDIFEYFNFEAFKELFTLLNLDTVPVIDENYILCNSIEDLIIKATVKSTINPNVWAEGIVVRPYIEKLDLLLSRENFNSGRVSFKVINPEWLLKFNE